MSLSLVLYFYTISAHLVFSIHHKCMLKCMRVWVCVSSSVSQVRISPMAEHFKPILRAVSMYAEVHAFCLFYFSLPSLYPSRSLSLSLYIWRHIYLWKEKKTTYQTKIENSSTHILISCRFRRGVFFLFAPHLNDAHPKNPYRRTAQTRNIKWKSQNLLSSWCFA